MNRVWVPELALLPQPPRGPYFELSGAAMGTRWSVRGHAAHGVAAQLTGAIDDALAGIVHEMSQWEPHSLLSRFNALPAGSAMVLPLAFSAVLACALEVAAATDGAFDPGLGALVDLWGFGPRPATAGLGPVPAAEDVRVALDLAGWRKLAFDPATCTLWQPGGLRLDLAGIAKGYAVDHVTQLLQQRGVESCLVEIGGELRGCGVKPDGQPWWVEVERPPGSTAAPLLVALCGQSIATSGDYRRVLSTCDGRQYSHTIDPRSGRPLRSATAAVTVVHRDCMRADAWATALMVLGPDAGLALSDRCGLAARYALRGAAGIDERYSAAFATALSPASMPVPSVPPQPAAAPASRSSCRPGP